MKIVWRPRTAEWFVVKVVRSLLSRGGRGMYGRGGIGVGMEFVGSGKEEVVGETDGVDESSRPRNASGEARVCWAMS